jgi:malate dehydrogenase
LSHYAPSIPKENITALTRLDENRARSLLARTLQVEFDSIKRVTIWGNHSNTQFPDLLNSSVLMKNQSIKDGIEVIDLIGKNCYENEFIKVNLYQI